MAIEPAPSIRWLGIATEIADRICHEAYRHEGACTWMGTVQQGGGPYGRATFTWETLGADVYSGTSGIALFLADLYLHTGREQYRDIATEALRFSTTRLDRIPEPFRQGFYAGRLGVAYALARCGEVLDLPWATEEGWRELDRRMADDDAGMLLDVISGGAGSIVPLLVLARSAGREDLRQLAVRFGERIVASANRGQNGWTWGDDATGFHTMGPLTGYGHGAAGIGLALMELFAATGCESFREAGRQAFAYESSVFNAQRGNWPDFRFTAEAGELGHFGVAWCVGAPGIGLSRLRAQQIDPATTECRRDVEAALRIVRRRLTESREPGGEDFSLCHGWAGLGDFALLASTTLRDTDARSLAEEIAGQGFVANGGAPERWHCGIQRGAHPSLMLGLAGIGHFYLRCADPAVSSLTLVTS